MSSSETHPGYHIRENVIPKGMSVTDAAKLLGVGRPALSNLLNGKASLSPDMATRIEKTFGVSAYELMNMQAAYDTAVAMESGAAESSQPYVPVFLQLKALDIEEWAKGPISARHRMSVFLRILVHSTGSRLTSVDFPGNDDSERPGWDGLVEANAETPWIPLGKSDWEFGVNSDIKKKADGDYKKSIEAVPVKERKDITFVFVTPRRWHGKKEWQQNQKAKKEWKDVRVYDAIDLEQWLEQSIPGQAWFARERCVPSEGLLSLDACWERWQADCVPPLSEALFTEVIAHKKEGLKAKLSNPASEPITIVADSRDEALAFLHCLFSDDLAAMRDKVVVFTEPGALTKLASRSANFIPIITTRAVEQEFAPHKAHMRGIIVYPRNTANVNADITLEPLSYAAFEKALQQMGSSRDDVQRLSRESGRSLTILRRRLSKLPTIRTPEWAIDTEHATNLVPFLLAGAWKTNNKDDQVILELLAHETPYQTLEGRFAALLQLEDAPVWSAGYYEGLLSKMDALFAISHSIQRADLDTFFNVAGLVLSEGDPALELPEDKRWMASIYGKVRDISSVLRDGICETLVLLSVYGPTLFKDRLGVDPAGEASKLVRELLTPLTVGLLESQSSDLPMYAEAAPDAFLDILEADLESPDPESLKLMHPVSPGLFGRCYRSGLLWALENIAWAPEYLVRIVAILGRLAERKIDDNWANKPSGSLSAIFLYWMPQTAANIEKRIAVMKHLINKHPQVAWDICIEQFNGHSTVGNYSHKPRWRPDAHGYGEVVSGSEAQQFAKWTFEATIGWKNHTRKTLGDLVTCILRLPPPYQLRIWDLVDQWSKNASDEDRAWLRDKVRISAKMKYTPQKEGFPIFQDEACVERARRAYEQLKPKSPLMEHAWLFNKDWIEHSADEKWSGQMDSQVDFQRDFQEREKQYDRMRVDALQDIIAEYDIDGTLKLAEMGQAARLIGLVLPQIFKEEDEQLIALQKLINSRPATNAATWRSLVSGFLYSVPENHFSRIIAEITVNRQSAEIVSLLLLAPFQRRTWHFVDTLGDDIKAAYWKDVSPAWGPYSAEDMCLGVDLLLKAGRAYAAFRFAEHRLAELPPKLLFRIMKAIPADKSDSYAMQSYYIAQSFRLLHQSGEISADEMALLEFQYLDALDQEGYGIPNLEKQIEDNPDLFVQAISISYRREDGVEDSVLLGATGPEERKKWANAAINLLDKFARIPGYDKQGNIDAKRLLHWITSVRAKCKELARSKVGDFRIGKILAKAPIGKDAVWPCEPVRDVLEEIANERIAEGVTNALFNSRGVHWRDPGAGGIPERELSAKYGAWAEALDSTHPNVAKILRDMVHTYEHQASWEDVEAGVRKRLE
jgi:addiction module HigA family antidote